jgi:hypothetical protein
MALIDRWREQMAKAVKTLPFCRMHGVHLTVSVAARQHRSLALEIRTQ